MTGTLTGNFKHDGGQGTIVLLEVDNGHWIASEPRIADDLLSAIIFDGEIIDVDYEEWQIV